MLQHKKYLLEEEFIYDGHGRENWAQKSRPGLISVSKIKILSIYLSVQCEEKLNHFEYFIQLQPHMFNKLLAIQVTSCLGCVERKESCIARPISDL